MPPLSAAELIEAACTVGPPEWRAALNSQGANAFVVEPVYGGMSNLIFRLSLPLSALSSLVPSLPREMVSLVRLQQPACRRMMARVLSPQLDDVIDRTLEARVVSWISEHPSRIGPRLYGSVSLQRPDGTCAAVRFEECIEGRTLVVDDLRHADSLLLSRIARKTALLHATPPPWANARDAFPDPLCKYLSCVRALADHPRMQMDEFASVARLLRALPWDSEAAWLARHMAVSGGPTVLTHGDNQAGNWIQELDVDGDVVLIDYEYSRLDARGFDLGNLLCEATFDYTVTEPPGYSFDSTAYPSLKWQIAFFRAYADAEAEACNVGIGASTVGSDVPPIQASTAPSCCHDTCLAEGAGADTISRSPSALAALPPDLRKLADEARLGVLASHLYWALWGAVMAAGKLGVRAGSDYGEHRGPAAAIATGHSVFDYAHYGAARAAEFLRLKERYERSAVVAS